MAYLLLESGGQILLEDGASALLLEGVAPPTALVPLSLDPLRAVAVADLSGLDLDPDNALAAD